MKKFKKNVAFYILGLGPTATEAMVKKAYRLLSIKYHPDKNINNAFASEMFQYISDAYGVYKKNKTAAFDADSAEDIKIKAKFDALKKDFEARAAENSGKTREENEANAKAEQAKKDAEDSKKRKEEEEDRKQANAKAERERKEAEDSKKRKEEDDRKQANAKVEQAKKDAEAKAERERKEAEADDSGNKVSGMNFNKKYLIRGGAAVAAVLMMFLVFKQCDDKNTEKEKLATERATRIDLEKQLELERTANENAVAEQENAKDIALRALKLSEIQSAHRDSVNAALVDSLNGALADCAKPKKRTVKSPIVSTAQKAATFKAAQKKLNVNKDTVINVNVVNNYYYASDLDKKNKSNVPNTSEVPDDAGAPVKKRSLQSTGETRTINSEKVEFVRIPSGSQNVR